MSARPPPTSRTSRTNAIVVLALSVLVVSTAAIMIRLALTEGVPAVTISAWRLGIAAALLTALLAAKPPIRAELVSMSRRQWLFGVLAGIALALHMALWISSLSYTSVASSTALVTTNPIWIALFSWLVFREKLGVWLLVGIAAAMAGSGLIFLSDARLAASAAEASTATSGQQPMLGNALAVAASLTVCVYLLIGGRLRQHVSLLAYIWLVYTAAAVTLFVVALVSGSPLAGFSVLAWVCMVALAIGPQLLGHTGINWALKHVSAAFIAVAILGEPIGSALLAWLIFGEQFQPLQLLGFVLLLVGIYLAARGEAARKSPEAASL